jgi:glyoxylase-like metal-dependent hydrolase (beta-lactamase superfamily II)
MFVRGALVLVAAVVVVVGGRLWWLNHTMQARGAPRPLPPVGAIYQIAPRLYVVPEGGGNTAVFITAKGIVLVDTKFTVNWQGLLAQVRKVTDKPITCVINTHAHPDHTGGNVFLPESVNVIVQVNTAANMGKLGNTLNLPEIRRRAMRTYAERMKLFDGEDEIDLYYFGPAHTNGDTFVVFRSAGVMHAGDVFPKKTAPLIDVAFGGNGAAYADTLDKAIAEIRGVRQVITGHGPVFTWDDFIEFSDFYKLLLKHAQASVKSGKDKNRVLKEFSLPERFKDYKIHRALTTMDEIIKSIAQ